MEFTVFAGTPDNLASAVNREGWKIQHVHYVGSTERNPEWITALLYREKK
jgi:hypothetical protein